MSQTSLTAGGGAEAETDVFHAKREIQGCLGCRAQCGQSGVLPLGGRHFQTRQGERCSRQGHKIGQPSPQVPTGSRSGSKAGVAVDCVLGDLCWGLGTQTPGLAWHTVPWGFPVLLQCPQQCPLPLTASCCTTIPSWIPSQSRAPGRPSG